MQQLFNLFESFGLPYFRQGSLSDEDYPPEFFTYWNIDTPNMSFYDNKARRYAEYVMVGFYTTDSKAVYTKLDEFAQVAESNGFVLEGKPKDAPADKVNYYGRVCYFRIIHNTEV